MNVTEALINGWIRWLRLSKPVVIRGLDQLDKLDKLDQLDERDQLDQRKSALP